MIALILAIVALGVSIATLVITLKRKLSVVKEIIKETVIEPSQNTNNITITCDEYPFKYTNGTFIIDGNLQVTGGVSCLNNGGKKV